MERQRKDLTFEEKLKILKQYDKLPKMGQRCAAAQLEISQTTLGRILKKRYEIEQLASENENMAKLATKRRRTGKDREVEAALKQWCTIAREKGLHVNGPLIRQKAEDLAKRMGKDDFVATEGWFHRWKKRENIVYKRTHGSWCSNMESVGIAIATGLLKKIVVECFKILQEVWGHPDKFQKLLTIIESVHDTSKDLEEMAATERITMDKTLENSLDELTKSVNDSSNKLTKMKDEGFLKRLRSYRDIRKELKVITVDIEAKHKNLQFTMGAATYVAVKKLQETFLDCFQSLNTRLDNIDNQLKTIHNPNKPDEADDFEDVTIDAAVIVERSKLNCPILEPEIRILEKYRITALREKDEKLAKIFGEASECLINSPSCPTLDDDGMLLPSDDVLQCVYDKLEEAVALLKEYKKNDVLKNLLVELQGNL